MVIAVLPEDCACSVPSPAVHLVARDLDRAFAEAEPCIITGLTSSLQHDLDINEHSVDGSCSSSSKTLILPELPLNTSDTLNTTQDVLRGAIVDTERVEEASKSFKESWGTPQMENSPRLSGTLTLSPSGLASVLEISALSSVVSPPPPSISPWSSSSMEEAKHASPKGADAAAGSSENWECLPVSCSTDTDKAHCQSENFGLEEKPNLTEEEEIRKESTRLSLRANVGESGELSSAEQPISDKAQLQITLKTLKERMREREGQRRGLHDQLMDAQRLVCEHKHSGERSRHMAQELSKSLSSEANPNTRAKCQQLVWEFLEQREEQLLQYCSELERAREHASTFWHTINMQKKELQRFEEEKLECRAERAWRELLLRHSAGAVALSTVAKVPKSDFDKELLNISATRRAKAETEDAVRRIDSAELSSQKLICTSANIESSPKHHLTSELKPADSIAPVANLVVAEADHLASLVDDYAESPVDPVVSAAAASAAEDGELAKVQARFSAAVRRLRIIGERPFEEKRNAFSILQEHTGKCCAASGSNFLRQATRWRRKLEIQGQDCINAKCKTYKCQYDLLRQVSSPVIANPKLSFEERSAALAREINHLQRDLEVDVSFGKMQKPGMPSGRLSSGRLARHPSAPCGVRNPDSTEFSIDGDDSYRQRQAHLLMYKQQHKEKQQLSLHQEQQEQHYVQMMSGSCHPSSCSQAGTTPLSGGARGLLSWQRKYQLQQSTDASQTCGDDEKQLHGQLSKRLDGSSRLNADASSQLSLSKMESLDKKRYQKLLFQMHEQQWRNECVERKVYHIQKFLEATRPGDCTGHLKAVSPSNRSLVSPVHPC